MSWGKDGLSRERFRRLELEGEENRDERESYGGVWVQDVASENR